MRVSGLCSVPEVAVADCIGSEIVKEWCGWGAC